VWWWWRRAAPLRRTGFPIASARGETTARGWLSPWKKNIMVLLEFHLLLSLSHTLEIYTTKTFLNSWCAMRGILSLWVLCVRAAASSIPFKFQLSRPPTWPACFIRASQWTLLGYNAHKYSYRHAFRSLAAAAAVREQQRDSQCAVDIGYCSAALEEFLI